MTGDDDCVILEDYAIIRGNYDEPEAKEMISTRFEQALDTNIENIVIEPPAQKFGQEIVEWLKIGDWIFAASVVNGLSSLVIRFVWPEQFAAHCGLASCSILFSGIYTFSWQCDPCFAYKIVPNADKIDYPSRNDEHTRRLSSEAAPPPTSSSPDPSISPPLSYTTSDTPSASGSPPNEPAAAATPPRKVAILTRRTKSEIFRRSLLHSTVSLLAFTLSLSYLDRISSFSS